MSERLSAGALATIVVVTAVVLAPIASTAPVSAQATPPANEQFAVSQGTECTPVDPVRNSSQDAVAFYDYRTPGSHGDGAQYASYGTQEYQESQTSVMFFYEGANATSLVTVNDQLGDEYHGSTMTMNFTGLPADGEWAVRDDQYSDRHGNEQDDDWSITETTTTVDWKWTENRTDGGVYTGFGEFDGTTVVDPGFNEDAARWGEWKDSGDSAYYMEEWVVKGADGEPQMTLDMDRRLFVHPGGCLDTSPESALTGPEQAEPDTSVTFTANASTDDDAEVGGYEWDLDGDSETEEVTTEPTIDHTFAETGEHTVSVTAFDTYGNDDTSETTVTVQSPNSSPEATLDAPANGTEGEEVTLDASDSTDEDGDIVEYQWNFDGEGGVDRNTTSATIDHVYNESGEVTPTVTVVDDDNDTDTANDTMTIEAPTASPNATLTVPGNATTGEPVELDASGSTAEQDIDDYQWDFDGDDEVDETTDEATINHSYDETGEMTPTVTVVDDDGANDTASATISVTEPEPTLDAELSVETDRPTVNESVAFDGRASSPEEAITDYEWTFEGGGTESGPTANHTFEEPGEHDVTLEIESPDGETDTVTTTVVVEAADSEDGDDGDGNDGDGDDSGGDDDDSDDSDGDDGDEDSGGDNDGSDDDGDGNDGGDGNDDDGSDDSDDNDNNAGGGGGGGGGGGAGAGGGGGGASEPSDPEKPDIGPANVSVSDQSLVAGDSLVVDATLTNDGDAAGERTVELAVNGTVVENRTVGVEPNETRTVTFTHQFESAGNRTVEVNGTARTVNVAPAEPDISVAEVEQSNDSVLAGEPFELSAAVENTGEVAGNTSVELELFGEIVDTKQVTVPPGETVAVTFTREIQAPGSYTASVGNATVSLEVTGDDATTTEEPTTTDGSSDVLTPGFGPTVAVLALALAAAGRYAVRRKE